MQRAIGSSGPMDALSRSFRRMFHVPVMYWAIAMVVAAASALFAAPLERAESLIPVATPPELAVWLIVGFVVYMIVGLLVLIPLAAATTRAALAVFHGEALRFDMILAGFRRYGSVLAVGLLTALPLMVAAVVAVVIMMIGIFVTIEAAGPTPMLLWSTLGGFAVFLVLFIPAFYVMLRWSFGLFLVFDEGIGAIQALGRSWRLTQDRVLSLFVLAIVIGVAGAVAGLAPPLLVFTTGWAPLAIGEIYMEAKSGRPAPVRNWERETWADRVVVRDDED